MSCICMLKVLQGAVRYSFDLTQCRQQDYRFQIAGRIPWLKKLDGTPIDDDEREQGKALVHG